MALTATQLQALKTDIAGNANTVPWLGSSVAINTLPNNTDANFAIAQWYNGTSTPDYFVWRDLPMEKVLNTVTMAS